MFVWLKLERCVWERGTGDGYIEIERGRERLGERGRRRGAKSGVGVRGQGGKLSDGLTAIRLTDRAGMLLGVCSETDAAVRWSHCVLFSPFYCICISCCVEGAGPGKGLFSQLSSSPQNDCGAKGQRSQLSYCRGQSCITFWLGTEHPQNKDISHIHTTILHCSVGFSQTSYCLFRELNALKYYILPHNPPCPFTAPRRF